MSDRLQRYVESSWFSFCLAALLSMGVFALYGFEGWLFEQDSLCVAGGVQLAEGMAPMAPVLEGNAPLASIISGACVFYGRLAGVGDVLSVRMGWWLLSGLTGGSLFLLVQILYRNALIGMLATASFTGFWSFGREAVSGPNMKSPFVLFETLYLILTIRKSWEWAGVCAALAAWTWQPGILFVIAAILMPYLYGGDESRTKWQAVYRAATGIALPTIAFLGYFLWQGALLDLLNGSVLNPLAQIELTGSNILEHLRSPFLSLFSGFSAVSILSIMGLAYLMLHTHAVFHHEIFRKRDWPAWAPVCVTLPIPFILVLLDSHGATGLYPLIPYMVIGMAGLFWRLSQGVCSLQGVRGLTIERVASLIVIILFLSSSILYLATSESAMEGQGKSILNQLPHIDGNMHETNTSDPLE